MKKSDIRILIVEDDESLGRALEQGLRRSGYNPKLVASPAAAQRALAIEEIHGMLVDCMLPRQSGVEFAGEIRKTNEKMEIILTSGIYRDKAFSHDAMIKTKARAFFNKPFNLEEVVQTFDDAFRSLIEVEQQPLFELLSLDQYSLSDKLQALAKTPSVHGFDLPWIYCLLMDKNISGGLQITYSDGRTATVQFNKGRIVDVLYADSESYFGTLLVEKGFATSEQVQRMLDEQKTKKIGERLVDESLVSPHAIDVVRYEQMVIRISKTIQDLDVEIRFESSPVNEPIVYIDGFKFTQLLSDWICSKMNAPWFKIFYLPWLNHPLVLSANQNQINIVQHLPAGRVISDLGLTFDWPRTIDEITIEHPQRSSDIYRAIHFLLVQRILRFGSKTVDAETTENKRIRLNRIWHDMQKQNLFEILGVTRLAKYSDINRNYRELAKVLHPDRIPESAPDDLRELNKKVFEKITAAHETLSDETRRQIYLKTLEHGLADEILQAESMFEQATHLLKAQHFREARKIFEKVLKMTGKRSDTVVYYLWALIKEKRHRSNREDLISRVQDLLQTIAHEDRHSPQYFFVKGMSYELTGQIQHAYQTFKRVLSMDPEFFDAKKELSYIKQQYAQKKTSFTDELSVVVTKILGRKTG